MSIVNIVSRIVFPVLVLLGSAVSANAGTSVAVKVPAVAAPTELEKWCRRLVVRLPGITNPMCKRSELVPTGVNSLQGFPLLARQIPAVKSEGHTHPLLRVLLMGGIHGDELTSASIVFRWLELMPTPAAQHFEWSVVPVVNPDGLLAPRARRMNANGVDLNRNFPTPGWKHDAPHYWAVRTKSDPRRFPGHAPLSEPESRWVHDEMLRFRPDVIISVHAPFGVLDFDGPAEPPRRFGRLLLNRVGVYPGSLGNYSGVHKNVPVITIELPNAQKMPSEAEVKRIWLDMLGWIRDNVEPHTETARVHSVSMPNSAPLKK